MTSVVKIQVDSEEEALEIGYALLGRANQLRKDPNSENEQMARSLRDKGEAIVEECE